MFWLENVIFVFMFLIYEVILAPFVWLKVIYNIIKGQDSALAFAKYAFPLILWLLIGWVLVFVFILLDLNYLFKILLHHQGHLKQDERDEKQEKDLKMKKLRVFNEVREIVNVMYDSITRSIDLKNSKKKNKTLDLILGTK